jgi:hypothetical protein
MATLFEPEELEDMVQSTIFHERETIMKMYDLQDQVSAEDQRRAFLDLVMTAISYRHHDQLRRYLKMIPLVTMNPAASDEWLKLFLEQAYSEDNGIAMTMIINVWSDANIAEELQPILISLFRMNFFEPEFYTYLIKLYPNLTFTAAMVWLNNFNREVETKAAAYKIADTFGLQTRDTYVEIQDTIVSQKDLNPVNPVIITFIDELIREANDEVAPKPDWIEPPPFPSADGNPLPTQRELDAWARNYVRDMGFSHDNLLNLDPAGFARYMLELYNETRTSEDSDQRRRYVFVDEIGSEPAPTGGRTVEKMVERIEGPDFEDTKAKAVPKIKAVKESKLIYDPRLFGIFGPSFLILGDELIDSDSPDPCLRYGGCRMFVCWHFENIDDDDEEKIPDIVTEARYEDLEWFRGKCQVCGLIISQKHYALRMPMKEGGWDGCYCSFRCLQFDTFGPKDPRRRFIESMEGIIRGIGIYDRRWVEPVSTVKVTLEEMPVRLPSENLTPDELGANPRLFELKADLIEGPRGPIYAPIASEQTSRSSRSFYGTALNDRLSDVDRVPVPSSSMPGPASSSQVEFDPFEDALLGSLSSFDPGR